MKFMIGHAFSKISQMYSTNVLNIFLVTFALLTNQYFYNAGQLRKYVK